MIATQQELIKIFSTLPPEAQRQTLNFIAFLQQTYAPVTDSPHIVIKGSAITAQYQAVTLNDLISSIPNNFTYPDDVMEFTESEMTYKTLSQKILFNQKLTGQQNGNNGLQNVKPFQIIASNLHEISLYPAIGLAD